MFEFIRKLFKKKEKQPLINPCLGGCSRELSRPGYYCGDCVYRMLCDRMFGKGKWEHRRD